MDRRHHQMAGLGSVERQAHRLRIAHFADHQHVRVLAQRVQQGLLKAGCVATDLALAKVCAARPEGVLDGALDRQNMARIAQIDLLDQRGERRGFAAPGRTADQDQPVLARDQLL